MKGSRGGGVLGWGVWGLGVRGGGLRGRGQGTFHPPCCILHYHMVLRPEGTSHNNKPKQHNSLQILFYCLHPAAPGCGGESAIADVRAILPKLDGGVVERFVSRGVRYSYNWCDKSSGHYKTWQDVSTVRRLPFAALEQENLQNVCANPKSHKHCRVSLLVLSG